MTELSANRADADATGQSEQADSPVSWRAAKPGSEVFGPDGERVGTLREVAADDRSDIFHGLVVDRGGDDPLVLIGRDDVVSIGADRIDVALDRDAVVALDPWSDAGASAAPVGGLDT